MYLYVYVYVYEYQIQIQINSAVTALQVQVVLYRIVAVSLPRILLTFVAARPEINNCMYSMLRC
jgi:hypothetical protein